MSHLSYSIHLAEPEPSIRLSSSGRVSIESLLSGFGTGVCPLMYLLYK